MPLFRKRIIRRNQLRRYMVVDLDHISGQRYFIDAERLNDARERFIEVMTERGCAARKVDFTRVEVTKPDGKICKFDFLGGEILT